MKQINLIDKDLKKLSSQYCSISILLAGDGYCFSVKDDSTQRYMALRCIDEMTDFDTLYQSYSDWLKEIWNEEIPLKVKHLAYANRETLVVPSVFSDDTQVSEIMNLHFPNQLGKQVLKHNFDSYCFTSLVDEKTHQSCLERFQPEKTSNLAVSLLSSALKYAETQDTDSVYLQVWDNYFELMVISDKKLALYNTYRYKTGNDVVYFVLNAYKQLMLNPKTCPLMMSGWLEKNDNVVVMLKKFIRHMFFETLNPERKYSYRFQDTMPHYFIHFLNLD